MSCWVVPTLAAELWGVPVDGVLGRIRAGLLASRTMDGLLVVDVAAGYGPVAADVDEVVQGVGQFALSVEQVVPGHEAGLADDRDGPTPALDRSPPTFAEAESSTEAGSSRLSADEFSALTGGAFGDPALLDVGTTSIWRMDDSSATAIANGDRLPEPAIPLPPNLVSPWPDLVSPDVPPTDVLASGSAAAAPSAPVDLYQPPMASASRRPRRRVAAARRPVEPVPVAPPAPEEPEDEMGPDPNFGEVDDGRPLDWRQARVKAAARRRPPPRFG
jgi:hypothetical protein